MKKLLYLLSLSFLILQSCSSSDSSNANNQTLTGKLKRIHVIPSGGGSQLNDDFFYDDNGRLIKQTTTELSNNQITSTVLFLRDANGYIINKFESGSSNYSTNTNYVVDSNGVYLSSVETKTNAGVSNQVTASYSYTNNKISQINFSDGHQEKYTYDANGNCIKTEIFYDAPSKPDRVAIATFDNKVNPFPYDDVLRYTVGNNNFTSSIESYYDSTQALIGTVNQVVQYSYNSNNTPHTAVFTITDTITISAGTTSGAYEFIYY
ncbi:MAG: hypothetical protein RL427_801 [Bacteroidota bacterium]|jgi:hypothetical protein